MRKQFRLIAVLLMIALILTSCSGKKKEEPVVIELSRNDNTPLPSVDPEIKQEVEEHYDGAGQLIVGEQNPIQISGKPLSETSSANYLVVNGLSNVQIEDSINDQFKSQLAEFSKMEVPPFRGTGRITIAGASSVSVYAEQYLKMNVNDVISAVAARTITIDNHKFTDYKGLTYDVRSGKEMSLSDLFIKGYDYKSIINRRIESYIREKGGDGGDSTGLNFRIVRPFKGITEKQNFYLSSEGIAIILDYNNPELDFNIDGNYISSIFTIGYDVFDGGLKIDRKCTADLYESASFAPYLFTRNGLKTISETVKLYNGDQNLDAYQSVEYPSGFPKKLLDQIRDRVNSQIPNFSYYEEYLRGYPDYEKKLEVYSSISCRILGGYHIASVLLQLPDITNDSFNYEKYDLVFDKEGNEISFENLFVPGYDVANLKSNLFKDAIQTNITDHNYYLYNYETPEDLASDAKFTISNTGLTLNSRTVKIGIVRTNKSEFGNVQCSIDFKNIGGENLNF